jgi:hypothetical protein
MSGLQARLMSQALRKLTGSISKSHTLVIFINQIRMKIGVMFGNPETTTGGNALKFYSSVRLDIRRIGAIKDRDEVVGNQTRVKVVKNKMAPPFRVVEFDIMYGEGISKVGELIDLGVQANIVEKSGAWFSYDSQRIGQGRENAKTFLKEIPPRRTRPRPPDGTGPRRSRGSGFQWKTGPQRARFSLWGEGRLLQRVEPGGEAAQGDRQVEALAHGRFHVGHRLGARLEGGDRVIVHLEISLAAVAAADLEGHGRQLLAVDADLQAAGQRHPQGHGDHRAGLALVAEEADGHLQEGILRGLVDRLMDEEADFLLAGPRRRRAGRRRGSAALHPVAEGLAGGLGSRCLALRNLTLGSGLYRLLGLGLDAGGCEGRDGDNGGAKPARPGRRREPVTRGFAAAAGAAATIRR